MPLKKVLIVDDHSIFREGLRRVLERHPDLSVVGEAATGHEAVAKSLEIEPDLIIMDVAMSEMNGIEATKAIMAARQKTRIIILSVHSRKTFIMESLKAGARGYVLKDSTGEKLLEAVAAVLKGECYLDSPIASHIVAEFVNMPSLTQIATPSKTLTDREREILRLIVEGYSNREIAAKIFVSTKTVENHRANIMNKLDLHDVIGLVKYAIANSLVDPDSWSR
ncbi:MAG: response regulator transcription factor [Deltaproteobacteria bacterium]|nr:response regulator transcription factor [Deltaproteobacteria bacterium]